jgi:hypothetical protein
MAKNYPRIGMEYQEKPEESYDRLVLNLPLPRWMRLPEETRSHLRAARREQLLALRSLLDSAIDKLEKREPGSPPQP